MGKKITVIDSTGQKKRKKKKKQCSFYPSKEKKKIPTSLSALNRGLTGTERRSFRKAGIPEKLIRFLKERMSTPLNSQPLVYQMGKITHTDLAAPVCVCEEKS